jgi:hypothetical protein
VPPTIDPIGWYDAHGDRIASEYEALRSDQVHAWLDGLLPNQPGLAFDIGAGTGRDAAWLAAVVAIEPSNAMRRYGAATTRGRPAVTCGHAAPWPCSRVGFNALRRGSVSDLYTHRGAELPPPRLRLLDNDEAMVLLNWWLETDPPAKP